MPYHYQFAKEGLDATAEAGAMVGDDKEQFPHSFNEGKAMFILTKKGWNSAAKRRHIVLTVEQCWGGYYSQGDGSVSSALSFALSGMSVSSSASKASKSSSFK